MLNMTRVAIHRLAFLLLASGAWLATPALAEVQAQEVTAEAEAIEAARQEKLDELFDRLATAEEPEASKTVREIQAIWEKSGSDSMDLLLQRGLRAMRAQDYIRARTHLSSLTRLAPDFAEGWNAAATLAFLQQDYGRAVENIEYAIALEPRHITALTGLAMILEHVGKPETALKAWREVARLYPAFEKAKLAIENSRPRWTDARSDFSDHARPGRIF